MTFAVFMLDSQVEQHYFIGIMSLRQIVTMSIPYTNISTNIVQKNSTYNVRTSTNTWAIIRESLLLNNASLPENSSRLFYTEEFIYLVPYYDGTDFSGQLVRVRASTFADIVPDIEILNLAILDDELTGFSSGFSCKL